MGLFTRTPEPSENRSAIPVDAAHDPDLEEIRDVLRQAALGHLDARVVGVAHESPLAGLAQDLNRHLDLVDSFLREMSATLEAAMEGRSYRKFLLRGMLGDFAIGAQQVNASHETITRAARVLGRDTAATEEETPSP